SRQAVRFMGRTERGKVSDCRAELAPLRRGSGGNSSGAGSALRRAQQAQAEPVVGIVPAAPDLPAGLFRHRRETGVGVLVAGLDLHRLALAEAEGAAGHVHVLLALADQEGLDPAPLARVAGAVAELVEVEVAADLAVQAPQQVEG